jgi:hypothetical protein
MSRAQEGRRVSKYNFNVKLTRCAVDTKAAYGYWERRDGTEGGGLWFTVGPNGLELSDYDGAFELPAAVSAELRAAGFIVGPDFDADPVQS